MHRDETWLTEMKGKNFLVGREWEYGWKDAWPAPVQLHCEAKKHLYTMSNTKRSLQIFWLVRQKIKTIQ